MTTARELKGILDFIIDAGLDSDICAEHDIIYLLSEGEYDAATEEKLRELGAECDDIGWYVFT